MATREQLIEDFADHKYATGEKFERLINSMKVVQEPVETPAASGTSLSFIDSIEQDKDGKITATKKTLDLANAHELNPFKGWWKTGDTLPTSGFDGAYLYFKDTSELTGQTTIYRWNGTTYADTGTVVDTSNVQTFETGQALNGVAIDGTGLVNPAANALAKAVDIKTVVGNSYSADLDVTDDNGNVLARFKDGHIQTKYFDSKVVTDKLNGYEGVLSVATKYVGKKLSILGDSISTFGTPDSRNEDGTYCYSYYPTETCRYSEQGNVTEEGTTYQSIQFDVNDTYWMKLINGTGMVLGINESWRGTRVSGSGNSAFNNQNRINHLGSNGTPDVILIYGGTNDAGGAVTLGTFNTENPANYTDEQIAALPTTTFADAYRTMLIRVMKTYPMAEIVVILPTFTTAYYTITNLDLYVEVIKEACDFFGIKYIDARCTGINIYNKAQYLVDGIHPNANGMELLYQKIYKQLIFN